MLSVDSSSLQNSNQFIALKILLWVKGTLSVQSHQHVDSEDKILAVSWQNY